MYIYSNNFILTVLTQVGYGSNTYDTRFEYLFVMMLEIFSFVLLAWTVYTISFFSNIKQDDFKYLFADRMTEMLNWLRKLQMKGEGKYVSAALSSNIDLVVQDAFLYDFNMIVEEFPFY